MHRRFDRLGGLIASIKNLNNKKEERTAQRLSPRDGAFFFDAAIKLMRIAAKPGGTQDLDFFIECRSVSERVGKRDAI